MWLCQPFSLNRWVIKARIPYATLCIYDRTVDFQKHLTKGTNIIFETSLSGLANFIYLPNHQISWIRRSLLNSTAEFPDAEYVQHGHFLLSFLGQLAVPYFPSCYLANHSGSDNFCSTNSLHISPVVNRRHFLLLITVEKSNVLTICATALNPGNSTKFSHIAKLLNHFQKLLFCPARNWTGFQLAILVCLMGTPL